MNDRHKGKRLPESEVGKPCPRISELEGSEIEPRLAQKDLGWSKEQYCTLAESMNDGLVMINESMQITYVNSQLCDMVGYSRDELIGRFATDFHIETDQEIIKEQITKPRAGKHEHYEVAMVRKDGRVFSAEHSVTALANEQDERIGWVSVIRDLTDQKKTELEKKKLAGQLVQAKKLEAISALSGGVAQELSNLFQAVHVYVERLMWGKEQGDPRYQELLEITNAALRGAVLSRRLLAFSGIIESNKKQIDLNREIEEAYKLLRRTLPKTIELELQLTKDFTLIDGDPNQIAKALLALAVRARDAMPEGGRIVIETEKMFLDDDFRRTHAEATIGKCVLVTLTDTGPALGPESLEHVFDPFYAKKYIGEKTGFGLSMVYGIVKNHGGYISCSSEPDMGTIFKIYLPVTKQEAD